MDRIRLTGRLVRTRIFGQFCCGIAAWGTMRVMTEDDNSWYYDISTKQVLQGKQTNALNRMGPYPDKATAEQALEIAAERNRAADSDDEKYN